MKIKSGFTLTELLIVMSILIIMATILIGIINPIAMMGKARDSQRKKDLDRIKKAFEEYYNDKEVYPLDIGEWNIKSNCGTHVFSPYLSQWPCDPDGNPYYIWINDDGKSFRILVDLENESDKSIPAGWYDQDSLYQVNGLTIDQINYGVSSSNISWNVYSLNEECSINCYKKSAAGKCNSAVTGCNDSDGTVTCFRSSDCISTCQVHCCGAGCN